MIDVVAFAEILNEMNGISFDDTNKEPSNEEITALRFIHEREISKLKEQHPDILFAFDSSIPTPKEEWIPRNIDVYNAHFYYVWDLYNAFEKGFLGTVIATTHAPERSAAWDFCKARYLEANRLFLK